MSSKEFVRRALRSKFFLAGLFLVLFLVVCIVLGPLVIPFDTNTMKLSDKLLGPDGLSKGLNGHVLGTDALGRDILMRLCVGGRISFMIALVASSTGALLGTVLGLSAGYLGRTFDAVIMRTADVQNSINSTLLAIVVVSMLGASVTNLIIVMTITSWVGFARIVRSGVLQTKDKEFISASRVLGGSKRHIMITQILPNVSTSLIVMISQQFGFVILLEAALSFLGCGVPLPDPSWGTMISEGRAYIATAPWVVVAPGLALMITVMAFNFLGDGIRDVLDPKMRH